MQIQQSYDSLFDLDFRCLWYRFLIYMVVGSLFLSIYMVSWEIYLWAWENGFKCKNTPLLVSINIIIRSNKKNYCIPKILKIRHFKALLWLPSPIIKAIDLSFLELILWSYFVLLWCRWSYIKSIRNVLHIYLIIF